MSLKIKIKMRDICLKSTEKVIEQAEQLNNLADPQNKFYGDIFAIRDTISEIMNK